MKKFFPLFGLIGGLVIIFPIAALANCQWAPYDDCTKIGSGWGQAKDEQEKYAPQFCTGKKTAEDKLCCCGTPGDALGCCQKKLFAAFVSNKAECNKFGGIFFSPYPQYYPENPAGMGDCAKSSSGSDGSSPETKGCCRTKTLGLGQLGSSSYSYKCQENIPQKDCLADFQEFVAGGTVKAGDPCQCVAAATGGKKTGAPGQVVSEVKFDYSNVINPLKETNLSVVVGRVIKAILSIIGSIFLIMVIYGGFIWMTAMGNDAKVKQGRNILMWAVIGIIVIFLSWMLVAVVFEALGVR